MEVVVTVGAISQIITTNKPTPSFTGQMPFLSPNQQCQSNEGKFLRYSMSKNIATLKSQSTAKRGH